MFMPQWLNAAGAVPPRPVTHRKTNHKLCRRYGRALPAALSRRIQQEFSHEPRSTISGTVRMTSKNIGDLLKVAFA